MPESGDWVNKGMRFVFDHYYPESPYNVEVKSHLPYPAPAMQWNDFEMWMLTEIIYKTTVYVSGKRKFIKHHEPVSIQSHYLELDKTWVNTRRHSKYSADLRLIVENSLGKKIGVLFIDEIESYGTYELVESKDGLHIEGESRYDGCLYAGFMMKEVSVDEIKRMKQEK